jgi:signal transduction histidine kinase
MMDLTALPSASWQDFAELFFTAEEDRIRHSFLARNTNALLESTELAVIESRITQCAVPEVSDGCLIVLRSENGDLDEAFAAHRYESEEAEFRELRRLPKPLMDVFARSLDLRILPPTEVAELSVFLPHVASVAVVPLGAFGSPIGYCAFFQTQSNRIFPPGQTRLIRDLILQAERVISHARAAEYLRRDVRTREKFISIASHELKTPLTALKLQIDALRKNFEREGSGLAPERIKNSFKTLDRSISRLTRSIGMLFNLSEIRAGQIGLLKEPADLAHLIRDVLSRMESLMEAAGCTLISDIPPTLPAFFDARRIEAALINLLANAAKYAPQAKVEVRVTSTAKHAKIEIRDHGPGIPTKDHAKIFEAFNRGVSPSSVEGLGLGLFVTQGAIRAHGGTLSLTSTPGEGACFLIEIPTWQA